MHETPLPRLILALLAALAVACSSSSSSTRNQPAHNSAQLAQGFARALAHLAFINADADAYICGCYYEEDGYASPQSCMAANSVSEDQRQDAIDCAYSVVQSQPPAPYGIRDFVARYDQAFTDYSACLDAGGNVCSDAEFNRQSACRADLIEALESHPPDGASTRWFTRFNERSSELGCF